MMKLGQMASYLGTHMPKEARDALATLQSSSTAMDSSTIQQIIESEFGKPIDAMFDCFEPEAFAAASIGQVHRAVLNGQLVAVKVQYPDIEKLVTMDLRLVGNLFSFLTLGTSMPGKEMAIELRSRILEECDYILEAEHQDKVKALCSSERFEQVPGVIASHSSRRVLTSEFVDGLDFQTFCKTADQETKNIAAMAIFEHTFDAIFKHCYFNGDPHPGNYLFGKEGTVTFLDFGCIKKFDVEFINRWKAMAKSILEQDQEANLTATKALGMIGNEKKFDHDFHWEMVNHVYQPFMAKEPFTYDNAYNSKTNELMLWQNKNRMSARMPSEFLFINRLQWGLAAILADLNATNLWNPVFRNAIYSDAKALFN